MELCMEIDIAWYGNFGKECLFGNFVGKYLFKFG